MCTAGAGYEKMRLGTHSASISCTYILRKKERERNQMREPLSRGTKSIWNLNADPSGRVLVPFWSNWKKKSQGLEELRLAFTQVFNWCVLFVCVYFTAELAHELCQQLRRYQAAPGHQRCDEGASPALRHPPLPHQTHLCHLRRPLLRYQDTSVHRILCELIIYPQMHVLLCRAGWDRKRVEAGFLVLAVLLCQSGWSFRWF